MKKLLVILTVLLFSGMSYGQFHIGPQVGYSASNLSLDVEDIKNNMKSNLLVGVFMRFGQKIYVQPEINWLTQGSVFKYPSIDNISPIEQDIKLSTIQIPLNVGWRIINLKVVNIRVFTGLAGSIVVNKDIKTSGDDQNYPDALPTNDDLKNMIWQWDIGAGVDVLMFALDVKYMVGLNNMFDNIYYENEKITSKSGLFIVTLGWKIF